MSGDDGLRFVTGAQPLSILATLAAGCGISVAAAPGVEGLFGAGLFAIILTIAVVDWRAMIIPDWLNGGLLAFGLVQATYLANEGGRSAAALDALLRGMALGGVLYLVRILYRRFRARDGLGLGDVKLAAAGGLWVGWTMLPVVIEIAALSALAIFLVAPRLRGQQAHWDERLPFGSFLAPAFWVAWLIQTLS